ncbi:MAG: hypothetical protein FWC78_03765 [Defluviitaleaceae bacterium]|nr:hypothetical protein [Defluviitaleaceae bacterium]
MLAKKQEHAICPFCCHKFNPNQADFRLSSGKVNTDDKLFNYYLNILHDSIKTATAKAQQNPAVSIEDKTIEYDETDIERYGFVHRITPNNGKGEATEQRLCPNCHNNLPTGYGMRDSILISVLGDARSGKSVFLTVLVAELENNSDFVSKLTFIGDKQVRENFYETYQRPLFREHTLISSTKRKKLPPYAFNFWYQYKDENGSTQENAIDVIFYDIAGEDLRDEVGIRNNGFNIKHSSGIIFLIDPTNFTRLSDLFRFSDAALIDAIPENNSNQAVFDNLYNYFIGMDREKSAIPTALAISKADLFKHVSLSFFGNRPENRIQNLLKDEKHRGAVNMQALKGINHEVKELITHLSEDGVLNNAIGCFKNINCFAVSSLGKKPIVEKISDPDTNETVEKGFIDGQIEPFRVKEPFYWILMRHQLLLKYENGRYEFHGDGPSEEEIEKSLTLWNRILKMFDFFKRFKRM